MQGDNAIITFEETKVFEIENTSFLSIVKLYKTRDWGRVFDTNLYKKKQQQLRNTSCSSSFSIYLFRAHLHRFKLFWKLTKSKTQYREYM